MAIGGVVINFIAKTAEAVGDVDRLVRSLDKTDDAAGRSGGKLGGLAGKMKGPLVAGAAAAGAGILALGDFMVEAAQAALEDRESAEKLAAVLGNLPGVTDKAIDANEAWITSMQLATGVADTDLRDAIGKLALATGDLKKAQDLATIATDAAAGSGKKLTTVTDAVAAAAAGKTSKLQRLYPWLDSNKDGTLTLAEAMDGLKDKFGGAAKKIQDNRDPFTKLRDVFGEVKESIGTAALPMLDKFSEWFKKPENKKKVTDLIGAIEELATEFGEEAVIAIQDFLRWLGSEKGKVAMRDFAAAARDTAAAVGAIASAFKWLYDKWLAMPESLRRILTSGGIMNIIEAVRAAGGGRSVPSAQLFGAQLADVRQTAGTTSGPVIVTEEQIYRAVSQLLMRGDARNGLRPVSVL